MKTLFLLTAAALIGMASVSAFSDETSAPVPIHRTVARRHVFKPVKKAAVSPKKAVLKPAASSAK